VESRGHICDTHTHARTHARTLTHAIKQNLYDTKRHEIKYEV